MKCPVCNTEISESITECPKCRFDDLQHEFINAEDAVEWYESTVLPFRKKATNSAEMIIKKGMSSFLEAFRLSDERSPNISELSYIIENGHVVITCYNGTKEIVTIPNEIDGIPVTVIGKRAFWGCVQVKKVQLPDSVEIISCSAFQQSGIVQIDIPKSCQKIEKEAFACSALVDVSFSKGLISIGDGAFSSTKIKKAILPSGLQIIGNKAFYETPLLEIQLPEGIASIGKYAFASTKLQSIVFPESITVIPNDVCSNCDYLENIAILGAKKIRSNAFGYCHGKTVVKKLLLSHDLVELSEDSLCCVGRETNVIIPPNVKTINIFNVFHFFSVYRCIDGAEIPIEYSCIWTEEERTEFDIKHGRYIEQYGPRNIAFVNDNIHLIKPYKFSDGHTEVDRLLEAGTIFYCNAGSSPQSFAKKYCIPTKPLSEFPID